MSLIKCLPESRLEAWVRQPLGIEGARNVSCLVVLTSKMGEELCIQEISGSSMDCL